VIYLIRSWPRLSQTFIVNEVLALEARGVEVIVFSLVHSGEEMVQPQVWDVRARVRYLDDRTGAVRSVVDHLNVFLSTPGGYLRTLGFAVGHPELSAGYATCSTLQCFRAAVQIAATTAPLRRAGRAPVHVHAHFAHDPALVALLVRRLTGLPYSFTAHARDLVQIPVASLAARASEATTLVTCCGANAEYVAAALPPDETTARAPVRVIHHGVDLEHFQPPPERPATATPMLVSVGRLVEKKAFGDLLQAMGRLKASGHAFTCALYGDGPLRDTLVALRDALDLTAEVQFRGEQDREQIVAALRAADVFVLTPVVTEDGDRDGIPNVLVEAMACGLPVVTTSAGGITELVDDGANGYVTEPADVTAVTARLSRLLQEPQLRRDLGAAARRTVESDYDLHAAARELEQIFGVAASTVREQVP
jgi:glycosyltransferase involved in cell wall biosynthesis